MKLEKFYKNRSKRLEQIFFIADECGLIRESMEYECNKEDRSTYWYEPATGRRFRYNDIQKEIDISLIKMDRWCNSTLCTEILPNKVNSLRSLFLKYIYRKEDDKINKEENVKVKRKNKYYYQKSRFSRC